MKTRIIKLRSCLIDAKQFLNGGTKHNEGKEEVGRKGRIVRRWRKEWTLLNSRFYPSSSPLSCVFLRVTWKSIIEGITHSLNILEEWGVRSEELRNWGCMDVSFVEVFSAPINSWSDVTAHLLLVSVCEAPRKEIINISPRYHLSHRLNKYAAHLQSDNKIQQQTLTERRVDDAAKSLLIDVPF